MNFYFQRQYFDWKLCIGLWWVLSWWPKCIKLFSYLSLSRRELFWGIFCLLLQIILFSAFLYFLRTIQFLHINFFPDILGITLRVTSLKKTLKTLTTSPSLLRAIFRYLKALFAICFSIFWELLHLILWSLFFYYHSQCAKKNITAYILQLR